MVITGIISSIVFANQDTGYRVLRLDNNITAVGCAPFVSVGAEYKFWGNFIQNARHGKQFEFTKLELLPPDTEGKVIAFLGGGLIQGVGPATAKKIVACFGTEALDILETNPSALSKVRGISHGKALKIGESYAEIKDMQAAIMWLYKFELGLNTAIKIYKYYGDATIEAVAKNPYSLIETIDGVGFLTADKMAHELGVAYNGAFRVRAGVVHCLKERSEVDGDTYLPLPDLIRIVCRLLRIKMVDLTPTFNAIIEELCMDRVVVAVEMDGVPSIQLTKFFNAEKSIAQKLLILGNRRSLNSFEDLRDMPEGRPLDGKEKGDVANLSNLHQLIEHYEQLRGIKFHEHQKMAIKTAVSDGVCVITGGPGTGKTTIINAILYINKANGLSTQLLAPTGRAAKRIEEAIEQDGKTTAMTIHRCLDIDYKGKGGNAFGYEDPNNFIKKDMVIVDEFSMCDCLLTAQLLRKVMPGTKVVFIGDADQLPSVGAGNVLCDVINSGVVPVIRLTQIYRTGEDATIALNAHKINNGEMPVLSNKSTDFFFDYAETAADIKNKVLLLASVRLPKYLKADSSKIQVLVPLKQGEAGVINLNTVLQEAINPAGLDALEYVHGETTFRVGDRVMHTVNNYKQEWVKNGETGKGIFNGDIGRITAINREAGEIEVELEDGRTAMYSRSDLGALTLSYAITVLCAIYKLQLKYMKIKDKLKIFV